MPSTDNNVNNEGAKDTMVSETSNMPPSEPQATENIITPSVVNNTTPENIENKAEIEKIEEIPENTLNNQAEVSKTIENTAESQTEPKKSLEINNSSESPSAQMPVSEPMKSEPEQSVSELQKVPEVKQTESNPEPTPIKEAIATISVISQTKNLARELLIKARNMIQFRKRKKLDKIMTLFLKKQKITNDEVEKLMHVSDATATRYLSQLEKENKIKQTGKTGKFVFYSKI